MRSKPTKYILLKIFAFYKILNYLYNIKYAKRQPYHT